MSSWDAFRRNGWLSETPPAFSELFLARCRHRAIARGESVYRIGDPPDGLYGVVTGALTFEIAPHERGPSVIGLLRSGSWFGEAALFDRRGRLGAVTATRASECLFAAVADIDALAAEYPETWRWIGLLGVWNVSLMLDIIDDGTRRTSARRIAAALLRLGGVRSEDRPDDPQPEIDITQAELAHLGTTSRATVVEHLDQLERCGLIGRSYGRVVLLRPSEMRDWLEESDLSLAEAFRPIARPAPDA